MNHKWAISSSCNLYPKIIRGQNRGPYLVRKTTEASFFCEWFLININTVLFKTILIIWGKNLCKDGGGGPRGVRPAWGRFSDIFDIERYLIFAYTLNCLKFLFDDFFSHPIYFDITFYVNVN